MEHDRLRQKLREIDALLEEEFGVLERDESDVPLDTLIRTILSQNTNDTNSGRAYARLRERFPTWEAVLQAAQADVAEAIRVGGLSNQKSATIQNLLVWLEETRGTLDLDFLCDMPTEDAVALLSPLKGIGIKTITVTLCFACNRDVFPVDTHIHRVSQRLGFVPANAPAHKAHAILATLFPPGKAFSLHVNLILFGRATCHARKPACGDCPLREHCLAWPQFLESADPISRWP